MTDCTCSGEETKSIDEEIVESEDVEITAGLDEPVEVGKEEAVLKDMEATLMKLKEVINYLSEKEEEKMDHKKKDTIDELHKSLTTLKKYGINVYSGRRKTPAPKSDTPAVNEKTDWFNFTKSLDEVAYMKGEETKI